jgi:hypothetical protein
MEYKLDGNAAAGTLQAIFPFEMTLVQVTCTGCGTTNMIGANAAYMHGMGTIVRCPVCNSAYPRGACEGTLLAGYAGRARPPDQRGVLVLPPGLAVWNLMYRRTADECRTTWHLRGS